ncbi:MAG TPA: tRNA pseudouridine(38-40) synthase TruA [Steroidobacteraceae bacterium]|nr:tRNA pseudouridine(38-40) synthase TruA [Steroidobacteraceae bacterium]
MVRFAVGIEYDGTAYAGWQSQSSAPSIQALTEQAFSSVANEAVTLVCAGRTDAGVHAREQVAHFDTSATRPLRGWLLGANSNLPRDISVAWITPVPMHFHARYSAETRTYRYFIFNRPVRSALVEKRAAQLHRPLDHERMRAAAAAFIGEHDFSAFRSSECQAKSTVRRLTRMTVERAGDWIAVEVTANAFLHHMVRNLVGVLLEIGRGEQPVEWARHVLESRDRTQGGVTAPAEGLYMWSVEYPAAFGLPGGGRSAMIPAPFDARV